MNDFVVPLEAVRQSDAPRVGGKAAVLGTLLEAGFPVPAGLCVTTTAFHAALAPFRPAIEEVMRAHRLHDPEGVSARAGGAAHALAELLVPLGVPGPVVAALRAALPAIADGEAALAVRSSATAEDRPEASFAGQYLSVLGVRGEEAVLAAVLDCWRSFFSANALVARTTHGALEQDEGMGVLVQRIVDSECAGVCFTVDPVRQRRDVIVVDAAWGLGLGAVDGSVATDTTWVLRERLRLEDRRVVEKPEQIALAGEGGVQRVLVPEERRRAACLPEAWCQRVLEFALAAEFLLGRPQDLEWAIAGGQVWVLQSRPITALPPELQETPHFPVTWEREEDRRSPWWLGWPDYRELAPPLENDINEQWGAAWNESQQFLGSDESGRHRIINGRHYFSPIPTDLREGDRRVRKAAAKDLVQRLWKEGRTTWDIWGPEVIAATERLRAFDVESADGPKLAEHLEDARGTLRRHGFVHWVLFPWPEPPNPFHEAFARVSGLEGPAAEEARARLLEGEETRLTQLIDGLYALAETARATPSVAALVAAPSADMRERLRTLPEAAAFCAKFDAFLALYGDRTGSGYGSEVTLRTPSWHERPDLALAHAAPYLDPALPPPSEARARARAERDRALEALCEACTDQEAVAELHRTLAFARRQATLLEEHNYYIDQMSNGQLRAALMAVGRRLIAVGAIKALDDLYWLRFDEVLAAVREEAPASFSTVIAERQAQHAAWDTLVPPPLLGTPKAKLDERPPLKDEVTADTAEAANRLKGQAASAGARRGRARVVPGSVLVPDLAPGDILVAENVGPLWTPLFPILGGLVLDQGALTQHAATTAREYGVPAVLGTHNATRRIPDGAWITVDGTAGTVEIHAEPGGLPTMS